jgi:cell wall-associated NlpC family hydrolase
MRSTLLGTSQTVHLAKAFLGVVMAGVLIGCSSSKEARDKNGSSPPVTNRDTTVQDTTGSKTQGQDEETETRLVMVMNPDAVGDWIREHVDEWLGVPYKWSGESKQGVDCSGFVQAIYKEAFNWLLPRVTEQQVQAGRRIRPNQLRPGDLVFFKPENEYHHDGIYLGDNKFAHASSSEGVTIASFENRYWQRYYWTSRRLLTPSRIPDTLRAELLDYRRVPDSTASSEQFLSDKDDFSIPSRIDTSQVKLARLKKKPDQKRTTLDETDRDEADPSPPTTTLDSMTTAADTTERKGW